MSHIVVLNVLFHPESIYHDCETLEHNLLKEFTNIAP